MNQTTQRVFTIDYTLKNDAGEILDATAGNLFTFIHNAGQVIPGLEKAMENRSEGESFQVTLDPAEAYGEHNPALIHSVPLKELDGIENLSIGMMLQANTPQGVRIFHVTDVNAENATLDGNHPLAGQRLHFEVTVIEAREATEEDFAPAHSCCGGGGHGGGGCGSHEAKEEGDTCCGGGGHGDGGHCHH